MADFHFLRPLWLLAIIALIYLIWQLKKLRIASSAWHKVIPKHLTSMLLSNEENKKPISLIIPSIIGLLIIVAMAGPTWQKIPQPVFEVERGSVIVMDMSFSMLATDIKPNRLTMARFKAMDLVKEINEGEIGLVAYAGDAFVISPLTADINNINLLLPSLSPEIMPELGSNPYPALLLANEMLQNSGHLSGDIYWVTDGISSDELQDINDFIASHDHRVNILGVGTEQGAPITLANGELMKDRGGNIVIPKINLQRLSGISSRSSGLFSPITADESDIEKLGERPIAQAKDMQAQQDNLGDQWQEAGPYLLLIVLPLMLGYFRRGLLFTPILFAFALTTTYTPTVEAQEQTAPLQNKAVETVEPSFWDNLWKTSDQQASAKFEQKQYQAAAEQFNNPQWKASSLYKAGNYEQALQEYEQLLNSDATDERSVSEVIQSTYNHGNTLAQLSKYDDAIAKYDEVLAQQPDHADALANKALIEQLKQQQDEQEQEQNQDQNSDEQQEQDQEQQQSDKNEQQNQDQNQQGDSGQQDDQSQSENSEQQQDSQDPQSSDKSDDANPEQNDNADQNPDDKESDQQSRDNEQQNGEKNDSEQENQAQAQADNAEQNDEQGVENEQMAGMTDSPTAEEIEANQKFDQLLKKVTDDPHLLLRNKMQLEYQKRRQNRSSIGVKEKW
ncbi:vWA domain-containing protein [Thalassomonas sp. M1454]|uniref:vWA domain-containing protein n=1 Tax=Thalassomonas sp. M1454 TaxID=2594477 RepID=UPI00117F75C1|nr:VWA domain-containing protein [Thalassomonas sp. M1454]TRX57387.1 VWA domain-containing protein [Thalassomonas sp. M1454]